MAKTAALSLANSSWQSATVSAAPQQQLQPQLVNHTAGTSGYPNNNLDVAGPTSVSDEDMLQKMERMVSNRTGSRRKQPPSPSDHIDTSTATSSSSRLHSRLLARGPSSRSTVRESPRATVYPLGNQPNATSSTDSKRPADETNDASMNYDDDGNAKVLLPPTNTVTYPGVQSSSNKEPRRDAMPSDKLESITIGTRSFSNSSLQPSIVVAGGSSLSCKGAVGLQNLGNTWYIYTYNSMSWF
ncbi:hypothetical protein AaE_014652 [Aphanomyces astaci]|uniref:Uncharacterized protein n=1 Tax=Aphanomyces astaci TaxID=112090 RepID=A0A6A4Z5E0_APHAT|nr:hypothetical protein AaE_014652 [Aphanomyces astaci]